MSNQMKNQSESRERVLYAATRYLELKGYEILDVEWTPQNGRVSGSISVVAREDEGIVFVDVVAKPVNDEGSFDKGADREELERLAAAWLNESEPDNEFPIRFDKLSLIVMGGNRAFLRHHIGY